MKNLEAEFLSFQRYSCDNKSDMRDQLLILWNKRGLNLYPRSVEHSLWIESSKRLRHQRRPGANRMSYQAWEWPKYLFGARVTDSIKAFFDRPLIITKNRLFSWEKISKAKLCREIIIGCSETNFCAKTTQWILRYPRPWIVWKPQSTFSSASSGFFWCELWKGQNFTGNV